MNTDVFHILSTTRAVRRGLDLERDVPQELIDECLLAAQQAPTGGNREVTKFVVVRDVALKEGLAEIYREGWARYMVEGAGYGKPMRADETTAQARQRRVRESSSFLTDNLHRVPVLVIPCVRIATVDAPLVVQATAFGSVVPATWSSMLAARARGLGTTYTTLHLFGEPAARELLGIPDHYQQVALIPTAFATKTDYRPGPRRPLEEFRVLDRWPDGD